MAMPLGIGLLSLLVYMSDMFFFRFLDVLIVMVFLIYMCVRVCFCFVLGYLDVLILSYCQFVFFSWLCELLFVYLSLGCC